MTNLSHTGRTTNSAFAFKKETLNDGCEKSTQNGRENRFNIKTIYEWKIMNEVKGDSLSIMWRK